MKTLTAFCVTTALTIFSGMSLAEESNSFVKQNSMRAEKFENKQIELSTQAQSESTLRSTDLAPHAHQQSEVEG